MFRCAFFSRSPVFRFCIYRQNLCTEFSCQSTAATTKCNKTWQFCCCEQQLSSNRKYNRNRKQKHCLQCWCLWYRLHKRQCYKLKTKTTQKTQPNKIYIFSALKRCVRMWLARRFVCKYTIECKIKRSSAHTLRFQAN